MGIFSPPKTFQNDEAGRSTPLAIYDFYDSGTFDRKSVFSDSALTIPLPNPVVSDAAGRFPKIYMDDQTPYRVVFSERIAPNQYNEIWTEDDVFGSAVVSSLGTAAFADLTTSPTDRTGAKRAEDENVIGRDSVSDLIGLIGSYSGQQCKIVGYHPNTTSGGGIFVYQTGTHDGGTFIDPDRAFPTPAQWASGASDPAVIAWFDKSGGVVDGWAKIAESIFVDDFGAIGDGVFDCTASFEAAGSLKSVKDGDYLLDYVSVNSALIGESQNTTLKLNTSYSIPVVAPDPAQTVPQQQYLPFIYTSTIGNASGFLPEVTIKNITIDYGNRPCGNNGAAPLWVGNVNKGLISNVRFRNILPSDYSMLSANGRGVATLLTFASNVKVTGCVFDDSASYEELGIRYDCKDIEVYNNLFSGNGPWRHNIEITTFSAIAPRCQRVNIHHNTFILNGSKQDLISGHSCGDTFITNNTFRVSDSLTDVSSFSGYRCLIKKFDGNDGVFSVRGNVFSNLDTPATLIDSYEFVRVDADNFIISGNHLKVDSSNFTGLNYPVIGNDLSNANYRNISITGNTIEVHDYRVDKIIPMVKMAARGGSFSDNTMTILIGKTLNAGQGIRMIDVNGVSGAGVGISITGNSSYGPALSYLDGVSLRTAASECVVTSNAMIGATNKINNTSTGLGNVIASNVA